MNLAGQKVKGHCNLTKYIFGYNLRILTLIMIIYDYWYIYLMSRDRHGYKLCLDWLAEGYICEAVILFFS